MKTKTTELDPARIMDLQFEVRIAKPPAEVWRALTDDIGRWWPGSFCCGGGRGPQKFLLEARPGGRMFEDWGGGDGLLWGTIVNVIHGKRLEVHGATGPAFGGPRVWYGTFEVEPAGDGTRLRFGESSFGRVTEDLQRGNEKAWRFLFDGSLRAYLEGTQPPVWEGGSCG
jgi:uncharacterized protein YndB with AHSA1/START domain